MMVTPVETLQEPCGRWAAQTVARVIDGFCYGSKTEHSQRRFCYIQKDQGQDT